MALSLSRDNLSLHDTATYTTGGTATAEPPRISAGSEPWALVDNNGHGTRPAQQEHRPPGKYCKTMGIGLCTTTGNRRPAMNGNCRISTVFCAVRPTEDQALRCKRKQDTGLRRLTTTYPLSNQEALNRPQEPNPPSRRARHQDPSVAEHVSIVKPSPETDE